MTLKDSLSINILLTEPAITGCNAFDTSLIFTLSVCVCVRALVDALVTANTEGSVPAAVGMKFNRRSRAESKRAIALAQKLIHML